MHVLLDTIDPATRCWIDRKRFEIADIESLRLGLKFDILELNRRYEVGASEMAWIGGTYGVAFEDKSLPVELAVFEGEFTYDEMSSHTGRELLLMLAGKKPLAAFSKIDGPEEDGIVPEDLFDPYVKQGTFVKKSEAVELTGFGPLRRILYAVPSEEWRIEAYQTLWRLADKHGWNDGFEKMEGFLLGYETEIDPFFE